MPIPSTLDLLYACIKDSKPKRISPEDELKAMVDFIVGDPDDVVGQCGYSAADDDDCWFIDDEPEDEYDDWY